MFDVFYIGNNPTITNHVPFARQVSDPADIVTKTKMYWLIDADTEVTDPDVLQYRPEKTEEIYTHVWKRDTDNYGGVQLLPNRDSEGVKQINQIVCRRNYEILFAENPGDYFEQHPYASYVWCIDPEYQLGEDIDWAPGDHEPDFIHSFHLPGQLMHRYPDAEGGVKLYPRAWTDAKIKYHGVLDVGKRYPVMRVADPEQYAQRDVHDDDFVWLIDRDYQIDESSLNYVPNQFEYDVVHSFRMPRQLTEKTWSFNHYQEDPELGGIRLVPRDWRGAYDRVQGGVIKHRHCPVRDRRYDVFLTNKRFTAETFEYYAARSQTDWFWVVDREYDFNGELIYTPLPHEQDYIIAFKWGLPNKYPADITELWDRRAAGIYLVNKNFDITQQLLHTDVNPVHYDVFYVSDLDNYQQYARLSSTDAFWMIDEQHVMDSDFSWVPPYSEQGYINVFKVPGQLMEKYPAEVTKTDNPQCGGAKLVPVDYSTVAQDIKYQGYLNAQSYANWETYSSIEQGAAECTTEWFWVVDPDVEVLPDFNFNFVPAEHDAGKLHVWQKLNPVTGRQYDYGGVTLSPKTPPRRGRPKYIREAASTQCAYNVCYLNAREDIIKQLEDFDAKSDTKMFWCVDPHADISSEFNFDYYPSQWDQNNVHVFLQHSINGEPGGVRLFPQGTFNRSHDISVADLDNNTFENLKQINTVCTTLQTWPVHQLSDMTLSELTEIISQADTPYVYTVDSDVLLTDAATEKPYMPTLADINKVHLWQRMAPDGSQVHSYGGLRLWPTNTDTDKLTTDAILTNKIKQLQYVREPGSQYEQYDLVLITYQDPDAETKYEQIKQKYPGALWVNDVQGIFNAHQEAARISNSKMFWVVDGDAELADNFSFSYIPDQYDHDVVHVWQSMNPITGDIYGYGGVKLFNREQVLEADTWGLDFTTGLSKRFKVVEDVSCITRFNTDAFSAWRSAFRESVKLCRNSDAESDARLDNWLNPVFADEPFAAEAQAGALAGVDFYENNADDISKLELINNYEWLSEQFNK